MQPLQGTATGQAHGPARVRYTHDAMIDVLLANPQVKQDDLAKEFGYSVGWVSRVIGSDAFQARLAERKDEVVNPEIRQNFEERLKGLALQSLEIIQRKLDATSSPDIALKALDLSTKALGMGARAQNVQTNNTYVVALPPKVANEQDWASQSRESAAALARPGQMAQAQQVVDVEARVRVS